MHRPSGLTRALDITLVVLTAPLTLVLIAACAIAVRLDSPGPIWFSQVRTGRDGRPFLMFKLRTMVRNAEQLKASVLDERTVHFKNLDDPRITRVGRYLRRTSLDELPQLFNVLRGEMSLVGPRPTSLDLVRYEPWHWARLEARPGLTGPWQVRGRNAMSFDERVRLDLEYIENMSFMTDLGLLFRTVGVVIRGTGA